MIDLKELGKRIREERRSNGITQQHLAKAIGVTPALLGHLENGRRIISIETLVALCNELHVSANLLLRSLLEDPEHIFGDPVLGAQEALAEDADLTAEGSPAPDKGDGKGMEDFYTLFVKTLSEGDESPREKSTAAYSQPDDPDASRYTALHEPLYPPSMEEPEVDSMEPGQPPVLHESPIAQRLARYASPAPEAPCPQDEAASLADGAAAANDSPAPQPHAWPESFLESMRFMGLPDDPRLADILWENYVSHTPAAPAPEPSPPPRLVVALDEHLSPQQLAEVEPLMTRWLREDDPAPTQPDCGLLCLTGPWGWARIPFVFTEELWELDPASPGWSPEAEVAFLHELLGGPWEDPPEPLPEEDMHLLQRLTGVGSELAEAVRRAYGLGWISDKFDRARALQEALEVFDKDEDDAPDEEPDRVLSPAMEALLAKAHANASDSAQEIPVEILMAIFEQIVIPDPPEDGGFPPEKE